MFNTEPWLQEQTVTVLMDSDSPHDWQWKAKFIMIQSHFIDI